MRAARNSAMKHDRTPYTVECGDINGLERGIAKPFPTVGVSFCGISLLSGGSGALHQRSYRLQPDFVATAVDVTSLSIETWGERLETATVALSLGSAKRGRS